MFKQRDKKKMKRMGLFMKNIMTRRVKLPFQIIGNNLKQVLQDNLKKRIEGRCVNEGFVKAESINIITYSSGIIAANNVIFDVMFESLICRPVEGQKFKCIIKNITKAGIRAERNTPKTPVVVFIARDHHYQSKYFATLKEGDEIYIRVIGQRFELNDKYISIIATLVEPKKTLVATTT